MKQQGLQHTTPAAEKHHRFTSPTPEPEVVEVSEAPILEVHKEPDPVDEVDVYDDYYYDDYYYYDDEDYPDSPAVDEAVEKDTQPLEPEVGHKQPPDETEAVTETSPTVSKSKPRFVRPTQLDITTSSFDIIEALKRDRTYTRFVAPTRTHTQSPRQRTRPSVEPTPTASRASNEVYSTYATTTLLPILGGERSITLTILTSVLTTLAEEELHLVTDTPELFDPTLATTEVVSAPPPSLAPSSPAVVDTQAPSVTHTLPDEVKFTSSSVVKETDSGTLFTLPETSRGKLHDLLLFYCYVLHSYRVLL